MTLKELTVKEALQLIAEKYPEPVYGFAWSEVGDKKQFIKLAAVNTIGDYPSDSRFVYKHFAIEVPDEYRYMTQQEHLNWLCLVGYKGHQMKLKKNTEWVKPYSITTPISMSSYEYRTVQEIDGKIVYGEPQEFKIKV